MKIQKILFILVFFSIYNYCSSSNVEIILPANPTLSHYLCNNVYLITHFPSPTKTVAQEMGRIKPLLNLKTNSYILKGLSDERIIQIIVKNKIGEIISDFKYQIKDNENTRITLNISKPTGAADDSVSYSVEQVEFELK